MDPELFDSVKLRAYHQEEPLIRETADQVIKDFGLFEMVVTFSGQEGTPYDELYRQLFPFVEAMLRTDTSRLFSLLYQIDIPDSWWQRIRQETDMDQLADRITDAILQRELIKVLTRNYFRQQRLKE